MAENIIEDEGKNKIENIIEDEGKNKIKNVKKEAETNKRATIMGLSIWRILAYFIIYSIVGYIIETIFGIITKGVWESRQSFLYGPFCAIYGVGAVIMIIFLHGYSKKYTRLFLGGFIVGSIVEYLVSWIGEMLLGVKWWDYSNLPFNINGRICLLFSIFWGALTLLLNKFLNPRIDIILEKISKKFNKKQRHRIIAICIILLFIDWIISSFAMKMFFTRIIYNNQLDVQGVETYYEEYLDIYQNHYFVRKIVDTFFSDKKMIRTFPNIKLTMKDGKIILVRDILKDIQPYYIKIFD